MGKLRKEFSKKDWKECCGNFCKTCEIACAYREKYSRHEARHKHKKDWKRFN